MIALIVSSQISARFLSSENEPSKLLPEIFPDVGHIGRAAWKPEHARSILAQAEDHIATMAVPYILAVHEGFIRECRTLVGLSQSTRAWELHETLSRHASSVFDSGSLCQFHVLREMRNSVIHNSGKAHQYLIDRVGDLTSSALQDWQKQTGFLPTGWQSGDDVHIRISDLIMALATTKVLAKEANRMIIACHERTMSVIVPNILSCYKVHECLDIPRLHSSIGQDLEITPAPQAIPASSVDPDT